MSTAGASAAIESTVSDEPTPEMARLQQTIEMIRPDLVIRACQVVRSRHGIPIQILKQPDCKLSDQVRKVRNSVFLQCGGAADENFYIYEPGIRQREQAGTNYALTALHTYVHEYTHTISGHLQKKKKDVRVNGVAYQTHVALSGYHMSIVLSLPKEFELREGAVSANMLFNEGVTETFAREAVVEYLKLHPDFASVSSLDVARHRGFMTAGSSLVFYPLPVHFLSLFVDVVSEHMPSKNAAWRKVYRGYFAGTDMLRDRSWKKLLERCFLTEIMEGYSGATIKTASMYIAMIKSPFRTMKIEVVHD